MRRLNITRAFLRRLGNGRCRRVLQPTNNRRDSGKWSIWGKDEGPAPCVPLGFSGACGQADGNRTGGSAASVRVIPLPRWPSLGVRLPKALC